MTTTVNKQTDSLHARISQGLLEELDSIATNMGRSRNWVFNEALKQYLEIQKWQVALIEDRLTQSQSRNARLIHNDEVMDRQEKRLKAKLGL